MYLKRYHDIEISTSGVDGEEFYRLLKGVIIDDAEVFNDKLAEWEAFYNCHRRHGALGGQART